MKFPRSCQHKEMGPCERCSLDFQARYSVCRALARKGLRVTVAVQKGITLAEWMELDAVYSKAIKVAPYIPLELSVGNWVPLGKEELPE